MSTYLAGLDIGEVRDFTALTILEVPSYEDNEPVLIVRHVERFKDMLYPDVAATVSQQLLRPPLFGDVELVVDATGVGRGTADIFTKLGYGFRGVIITGGQQEHQLDDKYWSVPKNTLISAALIPFQYKRLYITGRVPHTDILIDELRAFRKKQRKSTGSEFFEAREGEHDDLVLSLALACWAAKRFKSNVVDETLAFSYGSYDELDRYEDDARDADFSRWALNR